MHQPKVQPIRVKDSLYLFSQNKNPARAKAMDPVIMAETIKSSKKAIGAKKVSSGPNILLPLERNSETRLTYTTRPVA